MGKKGGGEREVRGVLHFGVLDGEAGDSVQSSAGRFHSEGGAGSTESTSDYFSLFINISKQRKNACWLQVT